MLAPPAAENAADQSENVAAEERSESEKSQSIPVQPAHLFDPFTCDP
jgi:hypothetical protein